MLGTLLAKVFGTQNERELKKIRPIVEAINALEPSITSLTDSQLREKTAEFRQRLAGGATLDDLLPEAFAVVREAGRRVLNMRHFDVQLIGGYVLHTGRIAEMKTGEGKTLVATLPAYLNALAGQGVHVVTVNDYLARRDSEWMGKIFRFLGMTVGVIQHDLNDQERQVAYGCDITYGTNNEFGFDYLRDNMKFDLAHFVQRGHHFAIVDEVDSILIDEARTPLIISGPAEESTDLYYEVDRIIPKLKPGAVTRGDTKGEDRDRLEATGDFIKDEKHKTVTLTESGMARAEEMLAHRLQPGGLYDPANMPLLHHVNQALRAHTLYRLDVDYMIKDGQVVIVDEFTGRLMPGRRWSDGLHQAVEAKEQVKIERENQTLATITFQNYFRKYKKLSGMTGTADTEAEEFAKIYKLDVMVIPTNRELLRIEEPDTVYRTEREKYDAIVTDIIEKQAGGRPTLVGTVSIEKSERLSSLLKKRGVKHVVLNAKYHAQEAEIVAQAGRRETVTIATNMAGRGTDILLGGNAEFMARQQALSEEVAERLSKEQARFVDDDEFVYFFHLDSFYRVPRADWDRIFTHFKQQCDADHNEVVAARRPAHHRHRAARGAAHRQPAARPRRPSGRPGLVALLPVARRRPDAHLRVRPHRRPDAASRDGRGRAHRARHGDARHRAGAEAGRGAELLRPQAPARVRRRHEQAAREHLHAAPLAARRHDSPRRDRGDHRRARLPDGAGRRRAGRHRRALRRRRHGRRGVGPAGAAAGGHPGLRLRGRGPRRASSSTSWAPKRFATRSGRASRRRTRTRKRCSGRDFMRRVERDIMLQIVDQQWKDHLYSLDHLKEGIGLRGYGQRDPLVEYKRESFALFQDMKARIEDDIVRHLWHLRAMPPEEGAPPAPVRRPAPRRGPPLILNDPSATPSMFGGGASAAVAEPANPFAPKPARVGGDDATVKTQRRDEPKVGRNDPCPCGSGKKYKKCHGVGA